MSSELSTTPEAPATPAPATPSPPAPSALRPRWRRWGRKILRMSVTVYLGLAIVFYLLQTWMIFPGASTQGKAEARVRPQPDEQLVALETSRGEKIYVLFSPALTAKGSPHPDAK